MRKLMMLLSLFVAILAVSIISPAVAKPEPEAWYRFRLNPFVDIINLNTNPGGWLNGYNEQYLPTYEGAVLGKFEGGYAYIACDLPPGGIEMFFIVINIGTRDGYMYRIQDDLSLIGPDYVWLTPAVEESKVGPTSDEVAGSNVAPQAWYNFHLNPYIDIAHMNTDLAPWLWGWMEVPGGHPCYPAPLLGYFRAGKMYFAWDFIDDQGCYEIAFVAGTVATKDGYMTRTIDGVSWVGPDYIWLTPA